MTKIHQFQVGGFDHNFSYIILDEGSGKVLVVDPCGDVSMVLQFIEKNGYELEGILITHSHFDHIEGIPEVLAYKEVPVYIHKNAEGVARAAAVRSVQEGDVLELGDTRVKVLHTPGHISDAVCFSTEEEGTPAIITGDTLFVEGCGRTNKEDVGTLYESLMRLKGLDDATRVYSGHDYGSMPVSTIAHEKEHNRFFLAPDLAAFKKERLG